MSLDFLNPKTLVTTVPMNTPGNSLFQHMSWVPYSSSVRRVMKQRLDLLLVASYNLGMRFLTSHHRVCHRVLLANAPVK